MVSLQGHRTNPPVVRGNAAPGGTSPTAASNLNGSSLIQSPPRLQAAKTTLAGAPQVGVAVSPKLAVGSVPAADEASSVGRILATLGPGSGLPPNFPTSSQQAAGGLSSSQQAGNLVNNNVDGLVGKRSPAAVRRSGGGGGGGDHHETTNMLDQGSLNLAGGISGTAGEPYKPYPDDPVDAGLAKFLSENPSHTPLFCRLSAGTYLYGTQRVQLRVDAAAAEKGASQGGLQAFDGQSWSQLGSVIQSAPSGVGN